MSRLVGAAVQLIEQVTETSEGEVTAEIVGGPDGYGRNRFVQFDADTSEWLVPVLEAIEDERIDRIDYEVDGVVIAFVGDSRADSRDPYPLEDVLAILVDEDDDEDDEPGIDRQAEDNYRAHSSSVTGVYEAP